MLKYAYCKEVFMEIPDEISLGISITGCQLRCTGCHSRELWEEKGEILDIRHLDSLLDAHKGISCLLLLGGEHDVDSLIELFMYAHKKIKTAWYSGLDMVPRDKLGILQYLDFIKLGHYDQELGGLDSPTTNQKLWKVEHIGDGIDLQDITFKLQKTDESRYRNKEDPPVLRN